MSSETVMVCIVSKKSKSWSSKTFSNLFLQCWNWSRFWFYNNVNTSMKFSSFKYYSNLPRFLSSFSCNYRWPRAPGQHGFQQWVGWPSKLQVWRSAEATRTQGCASASALSGPFPCWHAQLYCTRSIATNW